MVIDITTAVDSLVKLVNERGRISLEEASKILKISENIINEWATFLEEEEIITIEYRFTTPYLITNKSKEEKINQDEIDLLKWKLESMSDFVKNVEVYPKTMQYKQKDFLINNIKKLINDSKKIKDFNNFKENFNKLEKYYNIFKKNIK